ncbi:hypothetical protein G9A89_004795 [Geosiphon pyriformis]|nr:hypothetical protein G9A89_004795 [Geosiphon pyriformis]
MSLNLQELSKKFQKVDSHFKELPHILGLDPTGTQALQLYALRKQAIKGNCQNVVIDSIDQKKREKREAWKKLWGTSQDEAKVQYLHLGLKLLETNKNNPKVRKVISELQNANEDFSDGDSPTIEVSSESVESLSSPSWQQLPSSQDHTYIELAPSPMNSSSIPPLQLDHPSGGIASSRNSFIAEGTKQTSYSSSSSDEFEEASNDTPHMETSSQTLISLKDELMFDSRITTIEKTLERLQGTPIYNRRISEIEKALEKLQAEVSASHERIEAFRRDLIENEKKKQVAKKTWIWLIRIIAKHAIINGILILIVFMIFARGTPIVTHVVGRSRMQQIWNYTKRLLIDWKYNA